MALIFNIWPTGFLSELDVSSEKTKRVKDKL